MHEQFLEAGVKALGRPASEPTLHISKYHIQLNPDRYPELEDIDAILLTGSRMHLAQRWGEKICRLRAYGDRTQLLRGRSVDQYSG